METIEAINTRRSIRKYTDKPVPDETVEKILRAAMMAPSAGNQQPWHFIVVRDREILNEIPLVHPYSKMLAKAQVAIVVCGDMDLQKHEGYWIQDCSAATENLLLAAHALGLGAVWLGVYPREDRVKGISGLMGLPENIKPLSLVSIGYPGEEKPHPDRYDPSRIHHDRWQGKG